MNRSRPPRSRLLRTLIAALGVASVTLAAQAAACSGGAAQVLVPPTPVPVSGVAAAVFSGVTICNGRVLHAVILTTNSLGRNTTGNATRVVAVGQLTPGRVWDGFDPVTGALARDAGRKLIAANLRIAEK